MKPVPSIKELVPNAEDVLALEPDELAEVLLSHLTSGSTPASGGAQPGALKRGNFFTEDMSPGNQYPQQYKQRVNEALTAAWVWLEREGLLLPAPGYQDRDWVIVSERGKGLVSKEKFDGYRQSARFPRGILHPSIVSNTFALFLRGHYDTVVFEAFRAVEVAVRDAAQLQHALVGVELMRRAFAENTGQLTDTSLVLSEQQAMSHLFAGAMGLFKNPTSHRLAAVSKPEDAVSLVMFATYLLRLVEERARASAASKTSAP
jgi:uncharacterized protein (TIGR02391 family)